MLMILSFLFIGFASNPSFAADPNKAHPHTGVAKKFKIPKRSKLTKQELATLQAGKSVRKQVRQGKGGRGIAILDVAADPKTIFSIITDYPNYPKFIDRMEKAENYKVTSNRIFTNFVINATVTKIEYYIDHRLNRKRGYLTWTLDYNRESDLDDSTGYWLVYKSPQNPNLTRVEYSVDLRLKGWVPKFVETMLADQGLEDATKWVKKQAESR